MNDERLAEIRAARAAYDEPYDLPFGSVAAVSLALSSPYFTAELLEYVDELTRQRDDARRMVVDAGVFQNHEGTEYLPDPDYPWRADPVGPVAWDVQTEQPL